MSALHSLTSVARIVPLATESTSGGGSISLTLVLLGLIALVLFGFLIWYFLLKPSGSD